MENATKAIIIAGGVLITIMIINIGIGLVGNFGKASDSYVASLDGVELQKYNSNFEVFIGRKDVTAQEIVSVISIAQQKDQGTTVTIIGYNDPDGKPCMEWEESHKNRFLESNILTYKNDGTVIGLYSYVDDSIVHDTDGKVTQISFKKN